MEQVPEHLVIDSNEITSLNAHEPLHVNSSAGTTANILEVHNMAPNRIIIDTDPVSSCSA
jgi:hypothetical protein